MARMLAKFIAESLFQPFHELEEDNPGSAFTESLQRLPKVACLITKEKNLERVRHIHHCAAWLYDQDGRSNSNSSPLVWYPIM